MGAISEGVEGWNQTQGRLEEGVVNGTHREFELIIAENVTVVPKVLDQLWGGVGHVYGMETWTQLRFGMSLLTANVGWVQVTLQSSDLRKTGVFPGKQLRF